MNPPFSVKSWSNGLENEYGRFEFGRPPEKNGDYAFLLHVLKSLKSTGKAAIILPHGVLFRGNAEADHPPRAAAARLHQGHHRPAAEPLLRHRHPGLHRRPRQGERRRRARGVFMIDASKGFMKDGPKNRLRSQDIHKIVDVFNKQTEIERYSRMVPLRRDRRPKPTTTTSTSRATSTPPSPRTSRTCTPTCTAASRTATSTPSAATGTPSRSCARSCSSRTGPATATWPSTSPRSSRPSSTRRSSRSSPATSAAMVADWFAAHRADAGGDQRETPSRTT